METSIFLAKVLGLYFFIISMLILCRYEMFKNMIQEIISSLPVLYITAFITLILGLLLVVSHNIWVPDWRVLITIIAWITLIKGLIRISWPTAPINAAQRLLQNPQYIIFMAVICLLIGVGLIYQGFFAPHQQFILLIPGQ